MSSEMTRCYVIFNFCVFTVFILGRIHPICFQYKFWISPKMFSQMVYLHNFLSNIKIFTIELIKFTMKTILLKWYFSWKMIFQLYKSGVLLYQRKYEFRKGNVIYILANLGPEYNKNFWRWKRNRNDFNIYLFLSMRLPLSDPSRTPCNYVFR